MRRIAVALLCLASCSRSGLLVVAPEAFHDALGDFVAHKRGRLPTRLVSLERVLRTTDGADDPERLKRYLYREWRGGRAAYVLLVGDADVLPVRYMVLDRVTDPAFHVAFYPSDLYYADLARPDGSFDDWNSRHDGFHAGYIGEVRGEANKDDPINFDAIDYRPDVSVGRWPVSTADEVRVVAEKTIAYERAARSGRASFVHVAGWVDCTGPVARATEALGGWEIVDGGVVDLMNAGAGLIIHMGHGWDDGWADAFSSADLARVENPDRLPVMMSVGCSTARFATLPPYEAYVDVDGAEHAGTNNGEVFAAPPPPPAPYQSGAHNPTGLGERLLRQGGSGAVAYIGCNTGSQPCALTLMEGFVEGVGRGERLGDAWSSAIAFYWERERLAEIAPTEDWYPASIFFQGMKFMLFGDPTLELWRPEPRLDEGGRER